MDVLDWCAASPLCEAVTASRPAADKRLSDRLAMTACYCCGAQARRLDES